ncbi:MAG: SdrD B-like domain-containing protein [Balneolaceae bacterium]|nr:SdrD B-like domain-containing protein [Balneolaceae bacterium]
MKTFASFLYRFSPLPAAAVDYRGHAGHRPLIGGQLRNAGRLLLLIVLLAAGLGMPRVATAQNVDLVLNVTDAPDPVAAGGTVTYSVRITNDDVTNTATGVELTVSVPADMNYGGFTGPGGLTCSGMTVGGSGPGTVTCSISSIATNSVLEFDLFLETTASGTEDVDFEVSGDQNDPDTANNTHTATTTVISGANLSITISGSSTAASGAEVFYTITVGNAGPDPASGVQVQYPIPTGLSITGGLPAGCSQAGGTITCSIGGSIASGGSVSVAPIEAQITVSSGSTITNSASVQITDSPPAAQDPESGNNTDTFDTSVTAGSDVAITKSRSQSAPYFVGDTFNFVLAPNYTGDVPFLLEVEDVVPANYTINSGSFATTQNGWNCSLSGQTVTCTQNSGSSPGESQSLGTITIPVEVTSSGVGVTNTATITSDNPFDPDMSNNSDDDGGATLQDPYADLSLTKTGPNPALVVIGQQFEFTLRARNNGPEEFYGTLEITDALPANIEITGFTLNGWSCTPGSGSLPIAGGQNLSCERTYTSGSPLSANSNTPNLVLQAVANAAGSVNNTADLTTTNPNVSDTNPSNNDASYSVSSSSNPDAADLSIIKTVNGPDPVAAGEVLSYEIELVNNGADASESVTMTDNLTSLINNNTGASEGYVGHNITSYGVVDPGDMSCSTTSTGSYSRRLTCTVTEFPVCTQGNDCPTVEVEVRPSRATTGSRTNTAEIISSVTADGDLDNNENDVTSTVNARADVGITKTATPDPVPAGQELVYVVTAENNGPSRADNVTIDDTLPEDVLFISATPSSGSCSTTPGADVVTTAGNKTVECNLGNINRDAQQTVTITVKPVFATFGTTITNNATVSTTTTEPSGADPSNNSTSIDAYVEEPSLDLLINKNDGTDPVTVDNNMTYEIILNNVGPSDAENVVITEDLPAGGLSYVSYTISDGTCTSTPAVGTFGGQLICEIDRIPAGDSETLEVTVLAENKGVYTNEVEVESDETNAGYDSQINNNTASENTTVRTRVDLELQSKVPSPNPEAVRRHFNWVLTLVNRDAPGLAEADTVVVSDNLPATMELTGTPTVNVIAGGAEFTTCTGSAGDGSFQCELGTVDEDSEIEITIPVQVNEVPSGGDINNTASLTTFSQDVDPSDNSVTGTVTITGSSLSGRVYRDFDDDGSVDAGDTGISGVTMTLAGNAFDGAPISENVNTDGSGNFSFEDLPESDGSGYTVTRGAASEDHLTVGQQSAGDRGGDASTSSQISGIVLGDTDTGTNYLFAYVPQARLGIAKRVVGTPTLNNDGTFTVDFRLAIENFSLEALTGITFSDQVAGPVPALGAYVAGGGGASLDVGDYTVQSAPSFQGSCTGGSVNASFTGDGDPVVGSISSLAAGDDCQVNFSIRFQPPIPLPGGGYENQASIDGTGDLSGQTPSDQSQNGANPDPDSDDDPTDNDVPTPVNVTPVADVTTSLSFPASVDAGQTVSGTVTWSNDGPSIGDNMAYSLTLDAGLEDVIFSNLPVGATAYYNDGDGTVTLSNMPDQLEAGEIAASDPGGITVSYTQDGEASTSVSSTIATTISEGANALPNSATANVGGTLIADVETDVTLPAEVDAGQTVNGTLLYTNHGPSTASGVTYTLSFDTDLANVSFGNLPGGAGASYDSGTGTVTLTGMPGSLLIDQIASGNGSSAITFSYTQPGSATSQVESEIATATQQPGTHEPDMDDASVSGDFIADVTTSLVGFPANEDAGQPVTGRVVYRNTGPSTASGMSYQLSVDAGLNTLGAVTFSNLPGGASASYNNASGVITLSGMPASLTIGQIASGDGTNGIELSYIQPGPAVSTINSEIGTTTDQGANLEIDEAQFSPGGGFVADVTTALNFPALVDAGQTVSGTVRYRNNGPSEATGLSYTLTLDPNLEDVGFGNLPVGVSASYDASTGNVTLSGMPSTLASTEIASGDGSSDITVSFTQPGDATSEVSSTISTVTDQGANLAQDDDDTVLGGTLIADVTTEVDFPVEVDALTTVNGTVLFRNDGPSTASDVTYTLTLLANLEDVSFGNLPGGAAADYDVSTGIVTLTGMSSSLTPGQIASGDGTGGITVSYTQPAAGTSEVESEIATSTDQGANVLPDADDTDLEGLVADVTTEVVLPESANAGETVEGTLLYRNNGPSTGSGITYMFTLLADLKEVSFGNLPAGASFSYDATSGQVTFTGMPVQLAAEEIASGDGTGSITFTYVQPGPGTSEARSTIATSTNQAANAAPDESEDRVSGDMVADLAVVKTNEPGTIFTSTEVDYTMRVTNKGPSVALASGTITDTPEGLELISVVCTGAAGNRCTDAPSAAELVSGADLPVLEVDGFYEVAVTARVTAFKGTGVNTVEAYPREDIVDPDLDNNSASVSNPVLSIPLVGLAKESEFLEQTAAGSFRTRFTFRVENFGEEGLSRVEVFDTLATSFGGSFGEPRVSGGGLQPGEYRVEELSASGLTANPGFNGSGDRLLAEGSLGVGGSATIELLMEFIPAPDVQSLVNHAWAEGKGSESGLPTGDRSNHGEDPDPDGDGDPKNNDDITSVLVPSIGVAKELSALESLGNGRYDVTFNLHVQNLGSTFLDMVQVTDDLSEFGTFTDGEPGPGEYRIVSGPVVADPLNGASLAPVASGAYTGAEGGRELLDASRSSLPNGLPDFSRARLEFTLRFFPQEGGPFLNSATATARTPDGSMVIDESVDGQEPDIDASIPTQVSIGAQHLELAKMADDPVQTGLRAFQIPYRIKVVNWSETATATNVQISDDLTHTFPAAESISLAREAVVSECTGTELALADPGFDGVDQTNFLAGDEHLQPGESCVITFTAEIDFGANQIPEEPQLNQARATTSGVPGGAIITETSSENGEEPDPNRENDPTPVIFVLQGPDIELLVSKTSHLVNVRVGQLVPYTISVTNPVAIPIEKVEVRDMLPPGFRYRDGTGSVDGLAAEPRSEGRTLYWEGLTLLPEQTLEIRLVLVVGAGVQTGEYVNRAGAWDGGGPAGEKEQLSNIAEANVRVTPDPVFECSDIVGKVFDDRNANGVQERGEPGLADVRVVTAQGWLITTDAEGRYHIACAAYPDEQRGSNFVIKLDHASMPAGWEVVTENPRTVRLTAGKFSEVNFGIATPRELRLELRPAAFHQGEIRLKEDWANRLVRLQEELGDRPVVLRVVYRGGGAQHATDLARQRLRAVTEDIRSRWRASSLEQIIRIEEILELAAAPGGGR